MHLVLFRAAGDIIQVGFHGCASATTSHCDMDRVTRWAETQWRHANSFLQHRDNRHKVVYGVLPQSQESPTVSPTASSAMLHTRNIPTCEFACLSSAVPLEEVGHCMNLDALKSATSHASLLLAVVSPFCALGATGESISRTLLQLRNGQLQAEVARALGGGEATGGIMSTVLYTAWCTNVPSTASLPLAIADDAGDVVQDGLSAIDGSAVTTFGGDARLGVLHRLFPNYQTFRLLQSLVMLTQDDIVVVGNDVESVSSTVLAAAATAAPMTCSHTLLSYTGVTEALSLLENERQSRCGCIVGVHVSSVAALVMASLGRAREMMERRMWWIADTRTGVVARMPTPTTPLRSLIMVPTMERVKDVYGRASTTTDQLHNAMLESMAVLFGPYRRHLVSTVGPSAPSRETSPQEINVLHLLLWGSETVSSSSGSTASSSQQHQSSAFAQSLRVSRVWLMFQKALMDVESDCGLKAQLVASLRATSGSSATSPSGSAAGRPPPSMRHANAINFMLRSARRFPELFREELAAAGRPVPKDAAAAAGRLLKGLLGKAKDVVSQISGAPTDAEYSRYEQPYCECMEAFWSTPPPHTHSTAIIAAPSARHRQGGGECDEIQMPADVVHRFDAYHQLLAPLPTGSLAAASEVRRRRSSEDARRGTPAAAERTSSPSSRAGGVVSSAAGKLHLPGESATDLLNHDDDAAAEEAQHNSRSPPLGTLHTKQCSLDALFLDVVGAPQSTGITAQSTPPQPHVNDIDAFFQ